MCSLSMVRRLQHRLSMNVVHRQQGPLFQAAEEERQPEPTYRDGDNHIEPAQVKACVKCRLNVPEHVNVAHEHQEHRHINQLADVPLQWTRQQKGERHGKMEQGEYQADHLPSTMQSPQIPADFLWQIARPDNQPLREREVSPDHDERQHELAVVMNVIGLHEFGDGLVAMKNSDDHHYETNSAQ